MSYFIFLYYNLRELLSNFVPLSSFPKSGNTSTTFCEGMTVTKRYCPEKRKLLFPSPLLHVVTPQMYMPCIVCHVCHQMLLRTRDKKKNKVIYIN